MLNVLLDENGSARLDTESCLKIIKEKKIKIADKESREDYEGALNNLIINIDSYLVSKEVHDCMSSGYQISHDFKARLTVFREANSQNDLNRLDAICKGLERDTVLYRENINEMIQQEKEMPESRKLSWEEFNKRFSNDNEKANANSDIVHSQSNSRRNSEEGIRSEDRRPSTELRHPIRSSKIVTSSAVLAR